MKALSCVTAALATALLLSLPVAAAADDQPAAEPRAREPTPSGFRLGLRTGVGRPFGASFNGSGSMTDTVSAYLPVRLDVGYRIERHFYVGIAAQLASIVPANCITGFTCSGTDTRVGLMAAYHLLPTRTIDPYVGLGVGYEILHTSRSIDSFTTDITARGFELFDLELGADIRPGGGWRFGPVISGSLGRFTSVAVNGTDTTDFEKTLHVWALAGVRGAFDL